MVALLNSVNDFTSFGEVFGKIFRSCKNHVGKPACIGLGQNGNDILLELGVWNEEAQAGAGAGDHAYAAHDLMHIFGHEGDAAELLTAEFVEFRSNTNLFNGRFGVAQSFAETNDIFALRVAELAHCVSTAGKKVVEIEVGIAELGYGCNVTLCDDDVVVIRICANKEGGFF